MKYNIQFNNIFASAVLILYKKLYITYNIIDIFDGQMFCLFLVVLVFYSWNSFCIYVLYKVARVSASASLYSSGSNTDEPTTHDSAEMMSWHQYLKR